MILNFENERKKILKILTILSTITIIIIFLTFHIEFTVSDFIMLLMLLISVVCLHEGLHLVAFSIFKIPFRFVFLKNTLCLALFPNKPMTYNQLLIIDLLPQIITVILAILYLVFNHIIFLITLITHLLASCSDFFYVVKLRKYRNYMFKCVENGILLIKNS